MCNLIIIQVVDGNEFSMEIVIFYGPAGIKRFAYAVEHSWKEEKIIPRR